MTKEKLAKAHARQADYQKRKNINKYQPKVHTIEKIARYRPKISNQTRKPIVDSSGKPVLEHVGYKEVVRKEFKTKTDKFSLRKVRVLAAEYPKSKKNTQRDRKLKRESKK